MSGASHAADAWGNRRVHPGERVDALLPAGESYLGLSVSVPFHVWRAAQPGPTLLLTGAVHGDELNGTGTIRHCLVEPHFELARGTLVFVPVVNVPGFERLSRYSPDRRDLNRSFPGSRSGSLTSRLARAIFDGLVAKSDFCIDLHTAAVRRTNFPNVRADMRNADVRRMAIAFGAEVIVNSSGAEGSLRREANQVGCATILLEAGEVWKVEPGVVEYSLRGIRNVLIELGMVVGRMRRPAYQAIVESTRWIRAQSGGFLRFHIAPGELVEAGQALATATSLLGEELDVLRADVTGLVIGLTTLPSVSPGDPVVHIAIPQAGHEERIELALERLRDGSLAARIREELASNVMTSPAQALPGGEPGTGPGSLPSGDFEPGASLGQAE